MKLLFLTSRFPYPLEKGDKLRAFHLIKSLSKHNEIYLFAVNQKAPEADWLEKLKPYCKAIATGIVTKKDSISSMLNALPDQEMPFQVAYFFRNKVMKELENFCKEHQPEAVFCHLIRMSEYARRINIQPAVIDYMDAFSKGMERMAEHSNLLFKIPVTQEGSRLRRYEKKSFQWFNQHIIISAQDRDHMPIDQRKDIEVIPNGVDFNDYAARQLPKKTDLLFIGNMAYPPNISSAIYLAKKILPALHRLRPETNLLLAGANPVPSVKQLASDKITVSGWIENVQDTFAESKVMVAPMLISIGLQNKILQAMAMKTPCVISRLANNAIGAPENECVLVADHPEEYAEKIIFLLNNPQSATQMAEQAFHFVKQNFDWDKQAQSIQQLLIRKS
ncbi:glycosyltransferase [soil metagenome]